LESWDLIDYSTLIAAVYGTNLDCTNDVIRYVKENTGQSFEDPLPRRMIRLKTLRRGCDAYRERCGPEDGYIDTGFHRFDLTTLVWGKPTH
jgi:hypothetical protein